MYLDYDIWAVAIARFTPIPYKVFTIAAGAFDMDVGRFTFASFFSPGARFSVLAWLIHHYGAAINVFIDRSFNMLTLLFMVLLVGFFVLIAMW